MAQPEPEDPQAPKEDGVGARKQSGKNDRDQDLWRFLGLGTQLTVTVGLFAVLGWWLDKRYAWAPWGLVVSSSVGIAVGMYGFLKDVLH